MRVLVVYDTVYGNTEWVARSIGDGLKGHDVRLVRAADAVLAELAAADLLVVGAPTQRHRASAAMRELLDRLPRRSLSRVSAATFDTRYRASRFLTGSAAIDIARGLKAAGAKVIEEPQSFFMEADSSADGGRRRHEVEILESGELERAATWAAGLRVESKAGVRA